MLILPFITNSKNQLRLYLMMSSLLLLHWITNNDVCALTFMEAKLTGKPNNHTFIYQIIKPIYVIEESILKVIMYIVLIGLMIYTIKKINLPFIKYFQINLDKAI